MIRVGTRGSALATTQAGTIRDALGNAELTIISTPGDRSQAPVERIGVGVFTQELREAMARGECDIAVHSLKDLPTAHDPRFRIIIPPRADARDALIARDGLTLMELPQGARVGTSAPRRVAQLKLLRPDLDIQPLRGNIDTRMGRVLNPPSEELRLDAVILAAAGLQRLGVLDRATEIFDPTTFLPAPAQGALAVEAPPEFYDTIAGLECPESAAAALAERTVLATLEAGCTAPIGAHAKVADGMLHLRAGYFTDTATIAEASAPLDQARALGQAVAQKLL